MDAEFLRLASLGDMLKFHNKVMLDTPPYNTEYLDDILAAIDKQYLLKFKYVSGFGAESDIVLQPAFVRYFKQRCEEYEQRLAMLMAYHKQHHRCFFTPSRI